MRSVNVDSALCLFKTPKVLKHKHKSYGVTESEKKKKEPENQDIKHTNTEVNHRH